MRLASFRCEILFGREREPAWPRIGDLLAQLFPEEGGRAQIRPERGGHAVVVLGPVSVEATYLKVPSPDPVAAGASAAHVVLYAESASGDIAARRGLARALTMVAGALALRKDCTGMIWNDVPRLVDVEAVRRGAGRLARGRDPFTLWVDLVRRDLPAEPDRPPRASLRTVGLAAFAGREIELAPGPEDAETQSRIVGGVLAHIFAEAAPAEDGACFRIEEAGDFVVRNERRGLFDPGPVSRLERLAPGPGGLPGPAEVGPAAPAAARPGPEEAGAGPAAPPQGIVLSAILFADPSAPRDPATVGRAILKQARKLGSEPTLKIETGDRVLVDWGSLRGLGRRQTEVLLGGWSLPGPMRSFLEAENLDVLVAHPALLSGTAPVLVRDRAEDGVPTPSVPAALLVVHVAAAILGLPGYAGIVWPTAGTILPREAALAALRKLGAELPVPLCVAQVPVDLEAGRRAYLTRGLAELGEQDVVMEAEAGEEKALRATFEALVRGILQRSLSRRGAHHVNTVDGAEYELTEEHVRGAGTLLRARLLRPGRTRGGIERLFRRFE